MKTLLLSCLLAASASAAEVHLAWDASPEDSRDTNSCVTNYVIYAATNSIPTNSPGWQAMTLTNVSAGTNLTATVDRLTPGPWWFVATCFSTNGIESDPSNVLPTFVPTGPNELRREVMVQFSTNLLGTNWIDLGYFRIKTP